MDSSSSDDDSFDFCDVEDHRRALFSRIHEEGEALEEARYTPFVEEDRDESVGSCSDCSWLGEVPYEEEEEDEEEDEDEQYVSEGDVLEEDSHREWAHKEERKFRYEKNRGRTGRGFFFERHHSRGTTRHTKPHQARAARNWARSHSDFAQADLGVRTRYILRSDGAFWVTSLSLEQLAPGTNKPRWNDLHVIRTPGTSNSEPRPHVRGSYLWRGKAKEENRTLLASLQQRKQLEEATRKQAQADARRKRASA
jgi:hypothetical protein